jgi:predicted patatin/cPLA2 family phospholipase
MNHHTGLTTPAEGAGGRRTAVWCVSLLLLLAAGCSAPKTRSAQPREHLVASRDAADQRREREHDAAIERNLARVKAEQDDHSAGRAAAVPVVDMLIVSGGGDWGAFGAGFLKGWGTVPPGAMARPTFDAVTGVSTGALIAPFAFLGDEESIEKIVHLYRNPKKSWVQKRRLRSILRSNSFAEVPGLERDLDKAMDLPMLERIADAGATGRLLLVSTTNLDTEEMQVWDMVGEARDAVSRGKSRRARQVLLASSAVPGAFPPREIDGALHVDGGVTGNILYAGSRSRQDNDSFVARWQATYPGVPLPKLRYWIIFNNEVRWPPEVVQPRWPGILVKSSTASTRAATLNSIRHLFLNAELARMKFGADVEVRFVAVPDGWAPAAPGAFNRQTMNALADLGERMGADPSSWRTTPP